MLLSPVAGAAVTPIFIPSTFLFRALIADDVNALHRERLQSGMCMFLKDKIVLIRYDEMLTLRITAVAFSVFFDGDAFEYFVSLFLFYS